MNLMKKFQKTKLGFTLVEISIILAVVAVVIACLVPALINYTELSRMQRDESAMDELVGAFERALIESAVLDESLRYEIGNNFVTYTDSSGVYAAQEVDSEYWAPDGSGRATTITFNPSTEGTYLLSEGLVNEMTYGNGSVAIPTRLMDERGNADPIQCKFQNMESTNRANLLYSKVTQNIGETLKIRSAAYRNSSFTIFIKYGIVDGTVRATVDGAFNGKNLGPDSPAAIGSGTTGYDEDNNPNGDKKGQTSSSFDQSALQGGGSTSFNKYPVLENEYIDPHKFWDFCQTVTTDIKEIKVVAAYYAGDATDISVSGNGYIVAFQEGDAVYITAANPNGEENKYSYAFKVRPAENAQSLFDANKTGFENVKKISAHMLEVSKVVSLESMFKDNHNVQVIDLDQWNMSSVENFSNMFAGCSSLQNLKIVKWETPKATDMSYMFADCQKLKILDVSKFNTSKVENMSHMFYNCATLRTIDVSGFKTSNVRDMSRMFEGCAKVNALDVSKFDTSIVMSLEGMFKDCVQVRTLDISTWETPLCQSTAQMFMNCKSLLDLNLENFNTTYIKSMEKMFYACQNIAELDISNFNNLACDNVTAMFDGMNRLRMVTLGAKFSFRGSGRSSCLLPAPSHVYIEDADGFWRDEAGSILSPANIPSRVAATYHAVSDSLPAILAERDTWWKGETSKSSIVRIKIVNKYRSPSYDETWVADADNNGSIVVYIEGDTAYLVNMKNSRAKNAFQLSYDATNTFAGFPNLREIQGLRLINMINTTIADNFFEGCTSLVSIDGYERWNVQNLRSTSNMFASTKIPFLKLGAWDLATNTNFSGMFANTQLTELDLANWDVSNIESFAEMFKDSKKLTSLILKAWETNPNADYTNMFSGCTNLSTIFTSSTFTVNSQTTSMFKDCVSIVGGMGTTYANDSSLYARVDKDGNPGYFSSDENVGTFVAKLYTTGSISTSFNELTLQGGSASPWDYRQGARLLEISLYAMPKRMEKTLTISVPEGMKIVNNSWTQPNAHVTNVKFVPLDRNADKAGIQQNSGSYVNEQAGTLYVTLDANTAQTTIQMLVNVDVDLWSKSASTQNVTVEDAIVVSLCDGAVLRKLSNVTMGTGLAGQKEGFGVGTALSNSLIYEGQEQQIFSSFYLSKHEETASVYWTDVDIKITTNSSKSNQSAKIVGITDTWSANVAQDNSTDYVFHRTYKDIHTSSLNLPRLKYLCEEGKGWQKGDVLTVTYEFTVKYFNGETKTYTKTGNVTVTPVSDEIDWSLLTLSASSQTIPQWSYYNGAADDVVDHLGYTSLTYKGAVDIPNLSFKYEYDITAIGSPKVLVQAARVVLPKSQSVVADVTVVDDMGVVKGPYKVTLKSTSNNNGAYVHVDNVIPAIERGNQNWHLKSISYTIEKLTGSATAVTNYYATSAGKSTSSAGLTAGRAKEAGSHRVTISHNGETKLTKTYNTNLAATPTYSAYISAIATPLGSTITAGENFQLDVTVSACSYPYAITSNLVDPVVWIILPEDVSIIGAQVAKSNGTVADSNPVVTRLKSFYRDDGTIAYVYKINMKNPQLMSTFIAGPTSITSRNDKLTFKILVETDATMRSTTMMLRDIVWFSDSHGKTALSGSYGGYGVADKYDVNCNGNNTEQLSVTNKSNTSIAIQGVLD